MSKKITDIYKEYKILPNLQMHMLRVASVAFIICDNFSKDLEKENIVRACLLHDMGNIIKFKLDSLPNFLEPEGLDYWKDVQLEYIEKYGTDEYVAHGKIAKELGMSARVIELIQAISFLDAPANVGNNDFNRKIMEYSDERVGIYGVISLEDRLMDLRKRYTHHNTSSTIRDAFEYALHDIEKQIFANCKIKPEDITDASVAPIIEELKNFVIKS